MNSIWLSKALAPGERFALPNESRYSDWECRDPTSIHVISHVLAFRRAILRLHTRTANSHGRDRYRHIGTPICGQARCEKDAHGSLTFLGWPRCFADADTPSRFSSLLAGAVRSLRISTAASPATGGSPTAPMEGSGAAEPSHECAGRWSSGARPSASSARGSSRHRNYDHERDARAAGEEAV